MFAWCLKNGIFYFTATNVKTLLSATDERFFQKDNPAISKTTMDSESVCDYCLKIKYPRDDDLIKDLC